MRVAVASVVRRGRIELMRRSSRLAVRIKLRMWAFMVKWQSRVTPRFLTVVDKETDALPTVMESGRERDVDSLLECTNIISVLSSLNFSLFSAGHPGFDVCDA